jgi:GT2 family glycosyltransferase
MLRFFLRLLKERLANYYRLFRRQKLVSPPIFFPIRYKIFVGQPDWCCLAVRLRFFRVHAQAKLALCIFDPTRKEVLRRSLVPLAGLEQSAFAYFEFPAITDSAGREFLVEFTLDDPSLNSIVSIHEEWCGWRSKIQKGLQALGLRYMADGLYRRCGITRVRQGLLYYTYTPEIAAEIPRLEHENYIESQYAYRLHRSRLSAQRVREMGERIDGLKNKPRFSILLSVSASCFPYSTFSKPSAETLNALIQHCVDSILAQTYPFWELILVDDASSVHDALGAFRGCEARDPRIRTVHLSEGVGVAESFIEVFPAVTGDFVVFLAGGGELAVDAFYELALAAEETPEVEILYGDEDRIDFVGGRSNPIFKPGWSPELLRSTPYVGKFCIFRAELVRRIGGIRAEFGGAFNYDLVLRAGEQARRVVHVAKILYHECQYPIFDDLIRGSATNYHMDSVRGVAESYISVKQVAAAMRRMDDIRAEGEFLQDQQKVLQACLTRNGIVGDIEELAVPGQWRIAYQVPNPAPLVSIIIPTAGKEALVRGKKIQLLQNCLEKLVAKTTYPNYEIIVIHNVDLPPETMRYCRSLAHSQLIRFDQPSFNFSSTINKGAEAAHGEFLLFLNDDTEVIEPEWLTTMVGLGRDPALGVVGAKLLFENKTFQHIGVVLLSSGPHHAFSTTPENNSGPGQIHGLAHNRVAVTAACMLVRKTVFDEVGGFDPVFHLNYNDIDFCLKVCRAGYRIALDPKACLYHYESASKSGTSFKELELFLIRWRMEKDPYYNANYEQEAPTFFLRTDDTRWISFGLGTFYPKWIANRIVQRAKRYSPVAETALLSLITPTFNTPVHYLEELAKTVFRQTYRNFEWLIVDNGSGPETLAVLDKIAEDPRVKIIRNPENLGIIRANRMALETARGDFVFTLDHDDLLYLDALAIVAWHIQQHPDADLFYSDEDKLDEKDMVTQPYFKPDWDPVLLNGCCYIAHLSGIRRELALRCGVYTDARAEGTHDWDMFLRGVRAGGKPLHIREVLYTWRMHAQSTAASAGAKPKTGADQRSVLGEHVRQLGQSEKFEIEPNPLVPVYWRLRRKPVEPRPLKVILYSQRGAEFLEKTLHALIHSTHYPAFQVQVAGKLGAESLASIERVRKTAAGEGKKTDLTVDADTSLYSLLQKSAETARGQGAALALVSDLVRISTPDWAWEAIGLLEFYADAVLVGGKVVEETGETLYGAGYFGFNGFIGSPETGLQCNELGYFSNNVLQKSVDGVSPLFWAADPAFVLQALNQTDRSATLHQMALNFAFTAWEQNRRVICSPFIQATHNDKKYPSGVHPEAISGSAKAPQYFAGRRRYYHPHFFQTLFHPYMPKWETED